MRTLSFFIFSLLLSGFCFAQEKKSYQLKENEELVHFSETIKSPISKFREDLKKTVDNYKKRNPKGNNIPLYTDNSLNILFAEKIGTAFNTSSDLSLQKAYFNLDTADDVFAFGYNFDNRKGKELNPLKWVYSIGAKIKTNNKFAGIATDGDLLEDNISVNLKVSRIFAGTIGWGTHAEENNKKVSQRKNIETNRGFSHYSYNEKVKKYKKEELPVLIEKTNLIYTSCIDYEINKALQAKRDTLYLEMIKEELKYVDTNSLYSFMFNWWMTAEATIPVGDKHYGIIPITDDNEASNAQYYAFDTSLSLNFYLQKPQGYSVFGKLIGGIKGNNNIEVNGLKEKSFQSIIFEDDTPVLTKPVSAFEVEEYDRFITPSIKAEFAIFIAKNRIGFSPALEQNFGTYNGLNWKLGIPVSLKNKKGKPVVNIELQWKENKTLIGNEHLFGIASSFFFGDLIK